MKLNWLMFKQGIKSMFKQKIQFFVVIVLTFLAVFFLTTTNALTMRLNQAYDRVVANYDKFDYTYTRKASEGELNSSKMGFLPILDFIPDQNNYIYDDQTNEQKFSSFNLLLTNSGYGEENNTFITKTFESQEFENLVLTGSNAIFDTYASYFISTTADEQRYYGNSSVFDYSKGINTFSEGSKDGTDNAREFAGNLTNMLYQNFRTELASETHLESFSKSLFYKNWVKEKYKVIDSPSNGAIGVVGTIPAGWDYSGGTYNEIEVYILNALESVAYFVVEEMKNLFTSGFSQNMKEVVLPWDEEGPAGDKEKIALFLDRYNQIADENMTIKLWKVDYTDQQGIWLNEQVDIGNYNKELFYEYLTGKTTSQYQEPINSNFVISEENKSYLYNGKVSDIVDNKPTTSIITDGLRGMANPMSVSSSWDQEQPLDGLRSSDKTLPLEKLAVGQKYESEFNAKKYNYTDRNYLNKNIYSMDMMHQEFAAEQAGLDIITREEAFMYDKNTKTNVRFVIVDDEDAFNYEVMAGLPAMASNEVVISQQFAFKNGYSVGDRIKIGNLYFIISGFGADALTYYPMVDPEVPASDIKNSVIVYSPKSVLQNIIAAGSEKDVIFSTMFFLNDKDEDASKNETRAKVSKYEVLLQNDKKSLQKLNMLANSEDVSAFENFEGINKIKDFEETNFNLNWTLQPTIINIVTIISLVSSIFILIMAFTTIVFAIKKSIDNNSSQIAYLKSMGTNSYKISLSYLGYSIIIGLVVVPIAWVGGGLFQEVLSKIFSMYFSSTLYEFVFEPKMISILIILFGGGALLFSYLIALYLTSRNLLKIKGEVRKSSRFSKVKLQSKFASNLPFSFKFPVKLATRGWKQIFMITGVTFISTIVISISAAVPSVLDIYIKNATKYFNYQNAYTMNQPIVNLPTSKPSLNPWEGLPTTESLYVDPIQYTEGTDPNGNPISSFKEATDIYFDNVKYYNDSVGDNNIYPLIMGDANNPQWFEQYALSGDLSTSTKEDGELPPELLFRYVVPLLGHIPNLNGVTITPGTFERINNYFWNANIDPMTGKEYTPQNEWDVKSKQVKNAGALFNQILPLLIDMIKDTDLGQEIEISESSSWKEALILLAMSFLPNTGQQFLKDSPNRASQFVIGLNVENYTPGQETLATELVANVGNEEKLMPITGTKAGQTIYKIDEISQENINSTFIKDGETITQLETLFESNGTKKPQTPIKMSNGFVIYDPSKPDTLNIPAITNLMSETQYNLDDGISINSIANASLKIGNEKFIPTNAWIYDNRELTQNDNPEVSELFGENANNKKTSMNGDWIKASDIDPNKISHSKELEFSDNESASKNAAFSNSASWFISTALEGNEMSAESIHYELRPYYHYNNLKLFVPNELVESANLLSGNGNPKGIINDKELAWTKNARAWAGTDITYDKLPESVQAAWGEEYNGDTFTWIAPFNLNFSTKSDQQFGSLTQITDISKSTFWADQAIRPTGTGVTIEVNDQLPSFLKNVNVKSLESVDTYNGDFTLVDQDILNLLTGRSISKYIPVDYDFYGDYKRTLQGTNLPKGLEIPVFDMKTPTQLVDELNNSKTFYMEEKLIEQGYENPFDYAIQNRDFTQKYSAYTEPFGVTGGFKGVLKDTPGIFAIQGQGGEDDVMSRLSILYNTVDLAGNELGLIITMSESIMAISIFLIIGIILIAVLIISIMVDVYVMIYQKFIVTMRALGYGKRRIIINALGISSGFGFVAIFGGYFLGILSISGILTLLQLFGIYIPMLIYWWVPFVVVGGVLLIFVLSCLLSMIKPFKIKLTSLM
ncbi:ABC transporter permease [Mesoplasma photuris]|uniref:ABC transporter permease n=1 Tax=Mesoplasma photuris TaxID=217731 RepID=UPI0004E2216E|nr:FtsX-like permease family protein [Mesoplasma photuris]